MGKGFSCHEGSAYNEFGYNEHLVKMSSLLSTKIIDCNVKKFGYNEHLAITSRFHCIKIIDDNVKKFGYNEKLPLYLSTVEYWID